MTTAAAVHHSAPGGWLLVVVVVLALLYLALRTGRLGRLRNAGWLSKARNEFRGLHIRPLAFLPLTVLVIVVVLLLVLH